MSLRTLIERWMIWRAIDDLRPQPRSGPPLLLHRLSPRDRLHRTFIASTRLDQRLAEEAPTAASRPSPALRRRILAALRRNEPLPLTTHRPRRAPALAALALAAMLLITTVCALLQHSRQQRLHRPARVVELLPRFEAIGAFADAPTDVFVNPLLEEMKSIRTDVKRSASLLRSSLPRFTTASRTQPNPETAAPPSPTNGPV